MDNEAVIIKGIRGGVLLLLDDQTDWPAVVAELDERLGSRGAFFRGATVTVNLGRRIIDEPEWAALVATLARFDMTVETLVGTSTQTRAVATVHGVRSRAPTFVADPAPAPAPPGGPRRAGAPSGNVGEDELDFGSLADVQEPEPAVLQALPGGAGGLFLRRTLRSGQSIQHDGDVCIIGDVNAGAEVVASGDVVVWGSLRGVVHAGASGDPHALVCALQLAPTHLRIADTRSRGAEEPARSSKVVPEMARLMDGRIVVEPWTGLHGRK